MEPCRIQKHCCHLPAQLVQLPALRAAFGTLLETLGLDAPARAAWELVLTEAWNNAVEHGSHRHEHATVTVEWWHQDDALWLSLTDEGDGPPEELTQPIAPPEGYAEDLPRGLFLIQQHVDGWEHLKRRNGHTLLVWKHHRTHQPSDDALLEPLLEELSASYESLAAFYELGRYLAHAESLRVFVSKALDLLQSGHGFDNVRLILSEHASKTIQQQLLNLHGVESHEWLGPTVRKVITMQQERRWHNAHSLDESEKSRLLDHGMAVPIFANNACVATLMVAATAKSPLFGAADLSKVRTFGELVGIAIAQSHLRRERERDLRHLREYEIATDIQRNLLPVRTPVSVEGYRVCIRHHSAGPISGDYCEFAPLPDGSWIGTIIDVMGKGVSAALMGSMYRTAFLSHLRLGSSLEDMLASINQALWEQLSGLTYFITATLVCLEPTSGHLEHINAGHCPSLLLKGKLPAQRLEPSGPPLGLFPKQRYRSSHLQLEPDDVLMMVTDGCFEWEEAGQLYGWERFCTLARGATETEPEVFWCELQHMIDVHVPSKKRKDDETFFYLRRHPTSP